MGRPGANKGDQLRGGWVIDGRGPFRPPNPTPHMLKGDFDRIGQKEQARAIQELDARWCD